MVGSWFGRLAPRERVAVRRAGTVCALMNELSGRRDVVKDG